MAFKKPVVTEVKSYIQSISIYLRSVKKFGKTTLFRDLILEKFGDPTYGMLVGCGAEVGYNMLDNLNATQVESWSDMKELKKWLITQNGKEHHIKMVAFDVVGELIPMAEDEIIKNSTKDTGKICKSFNSAYGGYGEPRKRLLKLFKEYFSGLIKAGIQPFAIAHTKSKSIKEKGDDTEGYNVLTSDLSNDAEGIFGDIFDCVLTGVIDRDVKDGKITSETRKLYFRGNGYVDAGCRFKYGAVPEYIVFDKPNMAKDVITVLEEGLRKSRSTEVSDSDFKKIQEKENKKLEEQRVNATKEEENKLSPDEEEKLKEEKVEKIKDSLANMDMTKLKEIMDGYSVSGFGDPNTVPMECLDKILELI